jgi:hypothetical protein
VSKGFWVDTVDEDVARKVASIIGPSSAFGRALSELDERRAGGEDLLLVRRGASLLIVPRADCVDSIVPNER